MLSRVLQTGSKSSYLISSRAFLTARTYTSRDVGRNREIIQLLSDCTKEEEGSPQCNQYKVRAFKVAMKAIEGLDQPILSGHDAKKVKGIGEGIAARIGAFLNGGEYVEQKMPSKIEIEREKAVALISSVPGIGRKKATGLVETGCDTIEKLRTPQFRNSLSPMMKASLDYFDFSGNLINRQKANEALEFCRTFLRAEDEIHLVGSYRRNVKDISELEFLIVSHSNILPESRRIPSCPPSRLKPAPRGFVPFNQLYATSRDRDLTPLIPRVIEPLQDLGILTDHFSSGAARWRGWLRIPNRIVGETTWESRLSRKEGLQAKTGTFISAIFNYAPSESKGAALLALTGDRDFYLDIQSRANKLGMHLNEYGLWRWESNDISSQDEGQWTFVEGRDEAAVLKEIGMEYVEPEKRNFVFIRPSKTTKGKKVSKKAL